MPFREPGCTSALGSLRACLPICFSVAKTGLGAFPVHVKPMQFVAALVSWPLFQSLIGQCCLVLLSGFLSVFFKVCHTCMRHAGGVTQNPFRVPAKHRGLVYSFYSEGTLVFYSGPILQCSQGFAMVFAVFCSIYRIPQPILQHFAGHFSCSTVKGERVPSFTDFTDFTANPQRTASGLRRCARGTGHWVGS